MVIASFQFGDLRNNVANATLGPAFNMSGWIWADPIGWTSVNSDDPGACGTPPCGSYGLQLDVATRKIKGFAWNDYAGWICFGESCAAVPASCGSVPPSGAMEAHVDPAGLGTLGVHGWANVCNLKDNGWISLNCSEPGACGGAYPYSVKYVTGTGYFGNPTPPPALESYAWNGNADATGFGYMDFRNVRVTSPESVAAGNCADGLDNNVNGKIDCADSGCSTAPTCQENTNPSCSDGIDNNLNGLIDCQEASCRTGGFGGCDVTEAGHCADLKDNDGNGLLDCADPACAADPICLAPPGSEPVCVDAVTGAPKGTFACCHDTIDNDSNGAMDCADINCQKYEPSCLPARVEAKFGSIYSKGDISATSGTASFCLTAVGGITGFSSLSGCTEPTAPSYTLPSGSAGYKGTLGSLDIAGILAGHYGVVKTISGPDVTASIDSVLGGKVYYISGNATLGAKTFQNGSGTIKGSGLLVVEGDLTITGDVACAAENLPTYLRNLTSFGVIVKKNAAGLGGNIHIAASVGKLCGAFFAEDQVYTGTTGATDLVPLEVSGLMAARKFNLERKYRSVTVAAETFVFDGRAVANPPPGMSEVGKSLPTPKDAF